MNQNVLLIKISTYAKNGKISKIYKRRNKQLKINNFLLQGLQMFYIFWTNVWGKKYIHKMLGYRKRNHNTETDTSPPSRKKKLFIKKCVKYFLLHQHIQMCWYRSTLTKKCCKTGMCERTLLRSWFVKARCSSYENHYRLSK